MKLTGEQKKQYEDYDGEYGVDTQQKLLLKTMIDHDMVKPEERVEPILDILLNEELPHFNDENVGAILDIDLIESKPEILRKKVDENYEQYMIWGGEF